MNIMQAVMSGRRYRRVGSETWYSPVTNNPILTRLDVLADWEVESDKCQDCLKAERKLQDIKASLTEILNVLK